MGERCVVFGYIDCYGDRIVAGGALQAVQRAVAAFPFDQVYPFTDMFHLDSPAQCDEIVVGFCGAYNKLWTDFAEWLWKLAELLKTLPASAAYVHLQTEVMGYHVWTLQPRDLVLPPQPGEAPRTLDDCLCAAWEVTAGPVDDFTADPAFLAAQGSQSVDPITGELGPRWDLILPRRTS